MRWTFRTQRWTLAVFVFLCCVVVTAGCGSGKFFVPTCQETNSCGSTTYSSYAYVANASIGTIALFPLPKSSFTSLTGSTTNLGSQPSAIAATPSGTFLYVATAAGPVFVYSIGTNGALTLGNNGNQVTSTLNPTWMTIDPGGNWLFLVSHSSPQLLVFQIDTSTGALTQTSQGTIPLTAGNPTQVYVTPNGQNVYVGLATGGVDTFSFDSSSGTLSNHLHLAPRGGGADNAIGGDNNSAFLFVGEAGTGIRVLSIGSGGSLSEISGSPFTSQQLGPKSIVVDPTNKYVYVANSTSNVITGYTLAASGALTPLSSSPFTTGTTPTAMSLDSTGKYLLVISNGGGPDLQVFSFDTTTAGKLDSVTTNSTGTDPTQPVSLAVVP